MKSYEYFNEQELKKRGYSFSFVLYPDDSKIHVSYVLDRIETLAEMSDLYIWQYAYILHDKEEGKPHYHLCVKFKTQKSLKHVLDFLEIPNYNPNDNDPIIHSWKGALNYLIHNTKDSREKYQYAEIDVKSNISNVINNLRNKPERLDAFEDIIDYIFSIEDCYNVSLTSVMKWCRDQSPVYLQVFTDRGYSYLIQQFIKERNIGIKYYEE